jgi:AbrB family looped-hinge helix DNA binding protein
MQLLAVEDVRMKELLMTVTSKGQVTIPAEVRKHLKVKKGQRIALVIENDGEVKLKVPRYPDIDSIVGKAGRSTKTLSWHKTRDAARADHLRKKIATES